MLSHNLIGIVFYNHEKQTCSVLRFPLIAVLMTEALSLSGVQSCCLAPVNTALAWTRGQLDAFWQSCWCGALTFLVTATWHSSLASSPRLAHPQKTFGRSVHWLESVTCAALSWSHHMWCSVFSKAHAMFCLESLNSRRIKQYWCWNSSPLYFLYAAPQEVDKLPDYVIFKPMEGCPMKELFPAAKDDLIALLEALLAVNPMKRANCSEALLLPYFRWGSKRQTSCASYQVMKHVFYSFLDSVNNS